jgi:peptide/nickel transport system substrate-binding protein
MSRYTTQLFTLILGLSIIFCFTHCKSDANSFGNVVNVRLASEPDKLNPLVSTESNSIQVMANLFMPLIDFDPKTLNMVPALASTRAVVAVIDTGKDKGGVSYTFNIQEKAIWDNGQPVTADDVIFTFKSIFNPKSISNDQKSSLDFLSNIISYPDNPRKITFIGNKKYFIGEIACGTVSILPEYVYDPNKVLRKYNFKQLADTIEVKKLTSDSTLMKLAQMQSSPFYLREKGGVVGCGPYYLESWTAGQQLEIKKKTNWWGDALAASNPWFRAYPDKIIYRPILDETTLVSMIRDGKIDATSRLSSKIFLDFQNDDKITSKFSLNSMQMLSVNYAGFNCKKAKFEDKRVRRAIAHLFDDSIIIKNLLNGFAEPCVGPFPPARDYYHKSLPLIKYDLEKAKALLKEAGWADSNNNGILDKKINGVLEELSFKLSFANSNNTAKNISLLVQDAAKKVGINIEIELQEGKLFQENFKKGNFDVFISGFNLPPPPDDPKQTWASGGDKPGSGNRFGFRNATADTIIERIRTEMDPIKRYGFYLKFQELIYEEQPAVFLFASKDRILTSNRFDAEVVQRRPGYVDRWFKLRK